MFRSVVLCILLVLVSCSVAVCDGPSGSGTGDAPRQYGPNQNGIDFFGRAAQIVLWTLDGAHWIKIRFLKLQEVDAAGNVVAQAFNFDNYDYMWSLAGRSFANNWALDAIEIKLTNNNLIVTTAAGNTFPVTFQVDTFIFFQALNATFAGEKIMAKPGQLKWQVDVTGWKFQNAANKLRFGVNLLSDSFANNTAFNKLDPVPATVSSLAIAFGKGELILPRVALADAKTVNVTVNVLYEAGQLAVQWDYPSFTTSLQYDPVAATTDLIVTMPSGAAGKSVSSFVMILAILAAVWTMTRE